MSTTTYTTTRTFTHTATQLAGVMVSALAETLLAIGVSSDRVSRVFEYESAIKCWIEERSLAKIRVTLKPPGGAETAGYAFDIDYTAWDPEQKFRDQLARIRRQIVKEPRVRTGTDFKVIASPRSGYSLSDQPGWTNTNRQLPSFSNGYRHGTAGSGPGASAVLRSYRLT
ncbi:hypothetical protein [Candidatus Poriferisocius sp.]|uniref:hypothetical protein n=1 Tax=Candidatus Poriferisocius sp. TaxID=3101276 RepID=UPI003B0280EF